MGSFILSTHLLVLLWSVKQGDSMVVEYRWHSLAAAVEAKSAVCLLVGWVGWWVGWLGGRRLCCCELRRVRGIGLWWWGMAWTTTPQPHNHYPHQASSTYVPPGPGEWSAACLVVVGWCGLAVVRVVMRMCV